MSRSPDKAHISGFVQKTLKKDVETIAIAESRSVTQVLEFFLAWGVKHRSRIFRASGVKHLGQPMTLQPTKKGARK